MTTYIGIDPGAHGAAVAIDMDSRTISAVPFSKGWGAAACFIEYFCLGYGTPDRVEVCLERVHSMPNDSKSNAFTFGRNLGIVEGILVSNRLKPTYVEPKAWQLEFRLGGLPSKKARKHQAMDTAKEIFPDMKITLDLSDAILICLYKFRQETGNLTNGNRRLYTSSPFQSYRSPVILDPRYEV